MERRDATCELEQWRSRQDRPAIEITLSTAGWRVYLFAMRPGSSVNWQETVGYLTAFGYAPGRWSQPDDDHHCYLCPDGIAPELDELILFALDAWVRVYPERCATTSTLTATTTPTQQTEDTNP